VRNHRRQVNIGCVLMGSCNDVSMGVRVCVNLGRCDIFCSRDAIQVVSARDMVRLAQCICTMSALFRSIHGSHYSPLHCHEFVHVCMCEYAVFERFDLNYSRVSILCIAVSRFWLCVRGLP